MTARQPTLDDTTPVVTETPPGNGMAGQSFVSSGLFHVIGDCTIYNGDCLEIMPQLQAVDAVITDPPYGMTACEWDSAPDLAALWKELHRLCGGAIVMTAIQPFVTDLIASNREKYKHDLIWLKTNVSGFLRAKQAPLRQHEHILIFGENPKYNPQMWKKENYRSAQKTVNRNGVYRPFKDGVFRTEPDDVGYPRSVIQASTAYHERNAGLHPTQKPEGLLAYLVQTYTDESDTVLDCYMGSGTTAIACMRTRRKFVGIEKDQKHFATAVERISREHRQGVML